MQFSLFGAAVAEPSLEDLGGVLLAGGQWVRSGAGARLSVVVAEQWRADALVEAFTEREVAEPRAAMVFAEGGVAVRTAFRPELLPRALRWTRGANHAPPEDFQLTAGGLRLWAITGGRADDSGFVLSTAELDDVVHLAAGAQLSRLGLAGVSLTRRAGGPGWRVTSTKRLRRLGELLGEPPPGADWPG
ncbi:MAG: hypothetical protein ABJB98_08140 [Actinomycetota bacterium]